MPIFYTSNLFLPKGLFVKSTLAVWAIARLQPALKYSNVIRDLDVWMAQLFICGKINFTLLSNWNKTAEMEVHQALITVHVRIAIIWTGRMTSHEFKSRRLLPIAIDRYPRYSTFTLCTTRRNYLLHLAPFCFSFFSHLILLRQLWRCSGKLLSY